MHCVKESRWASGERYPFTVGPDGLGAYWPNLFQMVRGRDLGRAYGTMYVKARTVAAFHNWAEANGIDLGDRIKRLRFFAQNEIVSLRDDLRTSRRPQDRKTTIGSTSWGERCRAVAEYVEWRASFALHDLALSGQHTREERDRLEDFVRWLSEDGSTSASEPKYGLTLDEQRALMTGVTPGDPANPFEPQHQFRNFAMVLTYYQLGLRLSEGLALKGYDLDLYGGKPSLTVVRRADDPEDGRARQPVAKTLARRMPLSMPLAFVLGEWIVKHRSNKEVYPGAKRTPFVWVSERGKPLSVTAAKRIFHKLREIPGVPATFSAHVLRHTWNDRFSEHADETDMRQAAEVQIRNALMGWSATSEQGRRYTERSTRREADEVMLRLQNMLVTGSAN